MKTLDRDFYFRRWVSGAATTCRPIVLFACAWGLSAGLAYAREGCESLLFSCETDRGGKNATVCATEKAEGMGWENIQYQFGKAGEKPELVYPVDPASGASSLYFSHTLHGTDYRVTVRFESGGFSYRLYSHSGQEAAGVQVFDTRHKLVFTARCVERPQMFATYLRRALTCDADSPYGSVACQEYPFRVAK